MTASSVSASSPQRRCIGYADYVNTILTNDQFNSWFQPLVSDVDRIAVDISGQGSRLKKLQNRLVDLVNMIDPQGNRVSKDERSKV